MTTDRDIGRYLDDTALSAPENSERVLHRAVWIRIPIAILFAGLLGRLWQLQIADSDRYLEQSRINRIRNIPVPPPRGVILDRTGKLLATSDARYCACIVPAEISDPDSTISRLASLLRMNRDELVALFPQEGRMSNYVPIKIKKNLSREEIAAIEENRVRIPGVIVEPELVRRYTRGDLASHALGYTGEISQQELDTRKDRRLAPGDYVGKMGVEKKYDDVLIGTKGSLQVETDVRGNPIARVGHREERTGNSLVLTLDVRLQKEAEDALRDSGHSGAVVMMRVADGQILAIASYPSFDPNMFSSPIKPDVWKRFVSNESHPLLNRAVGSKYPPGSTFKMVISAAAFDRGVLHLSDTVHCGGALKMGRLFRCTGHHGSLSFSSAFAHSCNVYFMTVGRRIGPDQIANYARRLGLGRETGIDLPRESIGTLPDPKWKHTHLKEKWYTGDTLNMSIGQGFTLVTPLQMACLVSAVANGGHVPIPHLMKGVRGVDGGVEADVRFKVRESGIPGEVFEKIRQAMRQVVTGGTGGALRSSIVNIAGKTGSSQNVHGPKTHAWIACFAPYEKPEIACVVLMENAGHGGTAAAPIAKRLLEKAFRGATVRE